jgi:hypothetical protein
MRRALLSSIALCALGCDGSGSDAVDANGSGSGGDDAGGGSASPRTVKLTIPSRPNNATAFSFVVAYQDGSAPWAEAPAPTGDTYSFTINAPSYGVAFTCIANVPGTTASQVRSVTTAHFAVGERTELTLELPARCSDRLGQPIMLSGTVFNRPLGGVLSVQWGTRSAFVGAQSGNFTLTAPPGTHDLIVVHGVPLGNGDFYVDSALVQRDVTLSATATLSLDFAGARPTPSFPVTIDAVNARALATTTLFTANSTVAALVRETGDWETRSLAASQAVATDVYDQSITVSRLGESATITNATSSPAAQTWVAPAPLGAATAEAISKMPYPTLATSWPAYANVAGYTWSATQQLANQQCGGNTACTVVWSAYLSPGVVGAMPAYVMPDLAGLPGWKSALELAGGQPVAGSVTAFTSSVGPGDFPPSTPPTSGTKRAFVRSDFALTP